MDRRSGSLAPRGSTLPEWKRRSSERLVLELAGLSLGAIAAAEEGARRRVAPTEALWSLPDSPPSSRMR